MKFILLPCVLTLLAFQDADTPREFYELDGVKIEADRIHSKLRQRTIVLSGRVRIEHPYGEFRGDRLEVDLRKKQGSMMNATLHAWTNLLRTGKEEKTSIRLDRVVFEEGHRVRLERPRVRLLHEDHQIELVASTAEFKSATDSRLVLIDVRGSVRDPSQPPWTLEAKKAILFIGDAEDEVSGIRRIRFREIRAKAAGGTLVATDLDLELD